MLLEIYDNYATIYLLRTDSRGKKNGWYYTVSNLFVASDIAQCKKGKCAKLVPFVGRQANALCICRDIFTVLQAHFERSFDILIKLSKLRVLGPSEFVRVFCASRCTVASLLQEMSSATPQLFMEPLA